MNQIALVTLFCFLVSGIFSTSKMQADQLFLTISESKTMENKQSSQTLNQAHTEFGFRLFSHLVDSSDDQNVFISPTSVVLALSLLYNGASGQTQQEMAKALGFTGLSLEAINRENQALQETLQANQNQVELSIANSLWTRKEVTFRESFLQDSKQFYQAQIGRLDFNSPEAVKIINQWVSDRTRGKIDRIIDRIQPEDVLFLINAIYFKGMWQTPFDEKLTTNKTFNLTGGKSKQHPMMSRSGDYLYYETDEFQAVQLPYGDGRLNFYLFLPKTNGGLTNFVKQLNSQEWQQMTYNFRQKKGLLEMPRFKLEYESLLNETLKQLGMNRLFRQADFSRMTDTSVEVSEVKHKTFVEVNEQGTEAAAVTSIGIRTTSVMPVQEPFRMIVDRPFFCAIQDSQTETILFMGAIVDPKE